MSDMDVLREWEQRDDEPDNAYRAFKHFRDQKLDNPNTDRTLLEASRRYYENPNLKKTHDNILRWSKLYDWRERARAWDRYIQRRVDEAAAEGRADVARERGVTIADLEDKQLELNFKLAGVLLEKLEDPTFTDQIRPKDLTAGMRAITEFLNVMAKTGALRGEDPEHDEETLTDEQMERVDELFDQIIKKYNSEEN